MNRGRLRRTLAAVAGFAVVLAVAFVPPPQPTEATWTDSEHAKASFTATSLLTPTNTSCAVSTLLGLGVVFTGVTIKWTSPYPVTGTQLLINGVAISSDDLTWTGTGPYQYQFTADPGLLGSILGGLLGSTNSVVIRAVAGTNWTSDAVGYTLRVGGVLDLLGPNNCTPA